MSGLLFILSGPAGSGKTTLAEAITSQNYPVIQRVVTSTTRKPRPGEQQGIDYHFLSADTFKQKIKDNAFYEYAQVHNHHFYGTLKEDIKRKLYNNIDLLLVIDVQGANTWKDIAQKEQSLTHHLVTIFLEPPNLALLEKRLKKRASDDHQEISQRLQTAQKELEVAATFDHRIPTTTPQQDYDQFINIYLAKKKQQSLAINNQQETT